MVFKKSYLYRPFYHLYGKTPLQTDFVKSYSVPTVYHFKKKHTSKDQSTMYMDTLSLQTSLLYIKKYPFENSRISNIIFCQNPLWCLRNYSSIDQPPVYLENHHRGPVYLPYIQTGLWSRSMIILGSISVSQLYWYKQASPYLVVSQLKLG